MNVAISFISTLVAFTFAGLVLRQYLLRRRPHQAVWALSLLCFGIAVFVEFIANANGWSVTAYRLWFLFGAVFSAATLGLGTLYLLAPRPWPAAAAAVLGLAFAWIAYRVLTFPLDAAAVVPPHGQARPPSVLGLPADVTVGVVLLNSLGTVVLVGGALWSAWRYWRTRDHFSRAVSNLLIAAGAIAVAGSGSLAGLGRPAYLFLGELAGITLIFSGFLCSQRPIREKSRQGV